MKFGTMIIDYVFRILLFSKMTCAIYFNFTVCLSEFVESLTLQMYITIAYLPSLLYSLTML